MCDNILLENGQKMPQVGLGTWLSEPGEVARAVYSALNTVYRHIDCAAVYADERLIMSLKLRKG